MGESLELGSQAGTGAATPARAAPDERRCSAAPLLCLLELPTCAAPCRLLERDSSSARKEDPRKTAGAEAHAAPLPITRAQRLLLCVCALLRAALCALAPAVRVVDRMGARKGERGEVARCRAAPTSTLQTASTTRSRSALLALRRRSRAATDLCALERKGEVERERTRDRRGKATQLHPSYSLIAVLLLGPPLPLRQQMRADAATPAGTHARAHNATRHRSFSQLQRCYSD